MSRRLPCQQRQRVCTPKGWPEVIQGAQITRTARPWSEPLCEVMAVAYGQPEPFKQLLPWALGLERLGVAGFGWGIAWLDERGGVSTFKRPTRLAEDLPTARSLGDTRSRRFLVHLRRPSKLSTVQLADTQPFIQEGAFAFCHNGHLDRHWEHRERLQGRIQGQADSEIGFLVLEDLLKEGMPPEEALSEIHRRLAGEANLGFLPSEGPMLVYGGNARNALWRFRIGGAELAATGLHSDDESVFELLFGSATHRQRVLGVARIGESS